LKIHRYSKSRTKLNASSRAGTTLRARRNNFRIFRRARSSVAVLWARGSSSEGDLRCKRGAIG